jgi:hypothetical protein
MKETNKILSKYPLLKEEKGVDELIDYCDDLEGKIEDLNFELFDIKNKQNYSLENDMAEQLRSIYQSCDDFSNNDDRFDKLSKEEIIENIKKNIEKFAIEYKFKLK